VSGEVIADVLVACDEALINAFMHSGDVEGHIEVCADVRDHRILLTVRDHGCGFDLGTRDVVDIPDPLLTRGRGLFLIHALMDEVDIRSGAGGTLVGMVKRLEDPGAHR
jgi:serine/threonine-protein kinase RsbW